MTYDERPLGQLLEASQDLHSDAMRATRDPLDALVERGRERSAAGSPDRDELAIGHEFLAAGSSPPETKLSSLEQYAQLLLLTNEAMYID